SAVAAATALPGQPDPLTIGNACRDVDVEGALARPAERDGPAAAPVRLLDGQRQLGLLIRARNRTPPATCTAAEDPAEQILDVNVRAARAVSESAGAACSGAGAGATGPGTCPAAPPCLRIHVRRHVAEVRPESVVPSPGRRVRQDRVGLRYVLEPFLGGRIGVEVRVILAGQPPVGPLDLILAGVPPDAEDLVKVAVGHHSAFATTTWAGRSCRSPFPSPGLTTWITVPAATPGSGCTAIASCRAGSKVAPTSSRRG